MESPNNKSVVNLLECPLCLQTMLPPIFICEDRHNVCTRCRGKEKACPICNKPVSDDRNHLAETLAEQLPYPCSNYSTGCKEKFLLKDLPAHEAACFHRLYYCIPCQPRCRWRGRRFQVLEHMKDEHIELVWVKIHNSLVYENFDLESNYSCTHILSCLKEIFWCHSKRDAKEGKLYEVVQYIGRKEKAVNFEYEFQFYTKGSNRSVTFRNKVQSEDEDLENIYFSGDCLILDFNVIKHLITEDKKLFYNLKIIKMCEALKQS